MSLRQAYGAAVKAALGIIGFYIALGVAVLLGLWAFMTRDDGWALAGGALVVLGTVMTWLTVLAVIIKISVDEATRRTARHIDGETARAINRIGGRTRSAKRAPAGGGRMSWREAFGRAALAALGIIAGILFSAISIALGTAFIAAAIYVGFSDTVSMVLGAIMLAMGGLFVIYGVVMWILFPFFVVLRFSIKESNKRAQRRIDDAMGIITNRLDARAADAGRAAANESRAAAPPMPAGERPKSFDEATRRRAVDPPISERLSPFAEAARRRADAQTDPNETRTTP